MPVATSRAVELGPVRFERIAVWLDDAKTTLERHTTGPVTFYVFPYDEFTADTVARVGKAGFLGSRSGNRDADNAIDHPPINGADPTNDFAIDFDVWPRSYSKYTR